MDGPATARPIPQRDGDWRFRKYPYAPVQCRPEVRRPEAPAAVRAPARRIDIGLPERQAGALDAPTPLIYSTRFALICAEGRIWLRRGGNNQSCVSFSSVPVKLSASAADDPEPVNTGYRRRKVRAVLASCAWSAAMPACR